METDDTERQPLPPVKKSKIAASIPEASLFYQILFEQKRTNQRIEELAVQQNQRMELLEKQFLEHRELHHKVFTRLNMFLDSLNKMNDLLKFRL